MTDLNEQDNTPTASPELNVLLRDLLKEIQHILGSHLVGMYLEGSLANGDFDQDSDIDFVVVTDQEVSVDVFDALQTMHERFNAMDTQRSLNLEGSYISQHALRRYDPKHAYHPNIEWGLGERLKMVSHDETWNINRYILRERGITIIGPAPRTLIDPISPDELRQAMLAVLHGWATHVLKHSNEIAHQEYQSYTVLSICRILYTLEFGDIVSKAKAARWVKEIAGDRWSALIDRAWIGRHNPQLLSSSEDINQTLDFIRFALMSGEKYRTSSAVSIAPNIACG
jgi:predicted nucleotidyltransferase